MSLRPAAVRISAAVLLLLFFPARDPGRLWRNSRRRAALLLRSATLDPSVRRLNGSATAFDRDFFVFLESIRRRLPPGAAGLAIAGKPSSDEVFYLATYHFAPLPVLVAPPRIPRGWLLAVYGPQPPPGWRIIATVPGGALLASGS